MMYPLSRSFFIISIHAPREGGDIIHDKIRRKQIISIHAPREGGDWFLWKRDGHNIPFQSTPPARGATCFA